MYGYIGRIQRGIPYSPPSSPELSPHHGTPDLSGGSDSVTSPDSTSSLSSQPRHDSPHSTSITGNLRKLYDEVRQPGRSFRSSRDDARCIGSEDCSASDSQFDSLQDLLERAGYKETRVITPDRQAIARMASQSPRNPAAAKGDALWNGNHASTSVAATSLRQTIQRTFSDERKPAPVRKQLRSTRSSGWLFGAFWRAESASEEVPAVPKIPSIRITPSNDMHHEPESGHGLAEEQRKDFVASKTDIAARRNEQEQVITHQAAPAKPSHTSASGRTSTPRRPKAKASQTSPKASPSKTIRKQASRNQLWMGSLAYRNAKSQTAPVRMKGAFDLDRAIGKDTAAAADRFAQQLGAAKKGKRRTGLAEAFADSPTKPQRGSMDDPQTESPRTQRRRRNERAVWRESLQGLNRFGDRSGRKGHDEDPTPVKPAAESGAENGTIAVQLLAGPALPFLTMDPAVALRNEACLRPSHLRRMKSVDVLSKALQECERLKREREASSSTLPIDASHLAPPSPVRPPSPPTLMVSSPSGITSPKVLELNGTEFEPRSWSPLKGEAIISSRRVTRRRSKPRLNPIQRSPAAAAGEAAGLEAVRGRTKSPRSQRTCPTANGGDGPRSSVKSTAGSSKVRPQATRSNASGSTSAAIPSRQPFGSSAAANAVEGREDDDPFRCDGPLPSTIKKKAFMQSLSRGSKIAKLIEETHRRPMMVSDENSFASAGLDSPTSRVSANRRGNKAGSVSRAGAGAGASRSIRREPKAAGADEHSGHGDGAERDDDDDGLPRLSSSLSRSSARRMEALTMALRECADNSQL
ncbi:uncharacterized protein PFL1_01306 [Pseudozyma flocculosa PF-1]|uniref:Uncharacterized protein n=1 Tax=Pseudozyma flocculosa TaxID=84751 RepID=A0A5C3EY57_9BASI|nr:uncharacterized protein PFL1_01306 [Pseudozyma flocculosa PF-1]EPQ31117.1 hypothetical protein PFL1_01306 [Pseudozyma flocculosa PF-1]SPO35981.1 uncharacterized protein PSFLO_01452 [Pseudozyma flocculosa]